MAISAIITVGLMSVPISVTKAIQPANRILVHARFALMKSRLSIKIVIGNKTANVSV
jgi:hypothetical protein